MTDERLKRPDPIPVALVAPCGLNCRLCRAYGRRKNPCPGCRSGGRDGHAARFSCAIRECETLAQGRARYCFSCESFPCKRLKSLDKRYRTRYGVSVIENLETIRGQGVRRFIRMEKERFACPGCGKLVCMHKPQCPSCGRERGR